MPLSRTREIANTAFYGLTLGERSVFILPIVAGITTFIQQK